MVLALTTCSGPLPVKMAEFSVLFCSVSVPLSVPVVDGLVMAGEVSVLFVSVSAVPRNTNVSLASCRVHVRAAVTEPVSELLNPPLLKLCGKGKVVGPAKVLVPVKVLVVSSAGKV